MTNSNHLCISTTSPTFQCASTTSHYPFWHPYSATYCGVWDCHDYALYYCQKHAMWLCAAWSRYHRARRAGSTIRSL